MASILTKRAALFQPHKKEVSGTDSITLENSITAPVSKLVVEGECAQIGTPTPTAPKEIMCNNGIIKYRKSRLPQGYTEVEYIQSTGTQYINTNFYIEDLTQKYQIDYQMTVDGATAENYSGSNNWGYMGANGAGLMLVYTGTHGIGTSTEGVPVVRNHVYSITQIREADASRSTIVDGTVMELVAQTTAYPDRPFGIFALSPFATTFNRIWGKLYTFKAYKNDELVIDYIPCIQESNQEVGVYDMVAGRFVSNSGTDSFIAGPQLEDKLIIGTTDTVITVKQRNSNTLTDETISSINAASLLAVEGYKDTQDIVSGEITRRVGVKVLDGTESWREATHKGVFYTSADVGTISETYPVLSNAYVTSVLANGTMPDLTAKLAQTIAFGGAIHIVHDAYQDKIDDFKAYLAAQYAAGTPVIVLYPLATPTTEQVTAQPIKTKYKFNTIIEANGAITAKYWQPPF